MSTPTTPVKLWNNLLRSIPGPTDSQLVAIAGEVPLLRGRAIKRLFVKVQDNDRLLSIAGWSSTDEGLKQKILRRVLTKDPSEKDLFNIMALSNELRQRAWRALLTMEPSANILQRVLSTFSECAEKAAKKLLERSRLSLDHICAVLRYSNSQRPEAAQRALRRGSSKYDPQLQAALYMIVQNASLKGFAERAAERLAQLFPGEKNHLFVFNNVPSMRPQMAELLIRDEKTSLNTLLDLLRYPCGMRVEIFRTIFERGITREELNTPLAKGRLSSDERDALCIVLRDATTDVLQQIYDSQ